MKRIFTYSLFPIIVLLFILLAGCGDQTTNVDGNSGNDNGNNGDPPPADFSHKRPAGDSNKAFITNQNFDNLVVEIQYMPGAGPDTRSLVNLRDFLEKYLQKSSVTIREPREIPAGGKDSYTPADVRSLEDDHRTEFTAGNTLVTYAIFLDGEYQNENVLGIAYYNTSTAYFGETIRRISGGIGEPSRVDIESTVFNHEFGHLMGLVNNGTGVQEDHHDSENGAHCTVEDCLMYFSVQTTNFFANLFGGSIPELDEFCVADIEALK